MRGTPPRRWTQAFRQPIFVFKYYFNKQCVVNDGAEDLGGIFITINNLYPLYNYIWI